MYTANSLAQGIFELYATFWLQVSEDVFGLLIAGFAFGTCESCGNSKFSAQIIGDG